MMYIFIDSSKDLNRVGIVEDGRLVEFHLEKKGQKKLVGNIYRGRVVNVLQGMEAAFVNIGESKNAYLNVKDALPRELMYTNQKCNISDIVKSGEEIIVQVVKEPYGNKGAKVTTHIEIPGRFIVFTPFSNKINISKKITDIERINYLKEVGERIIRDDMGLIFRTASEYVDESILKEEYDILHDIYKKIQKEKNFLPCPKLIYKEPTLAYQIIRDNYNENTEKIIVNSKDVYNELIQMEEYFPFKFSDKLKLNPDFSIDYDTVIQKDIRIALEKKVPLKSGGYLVIDETEALTVIDVNTGKYTGISSLEDTILKTNLEAAEEIARQIRLRDIGGIIIIDFIDMRDDSHEDLVLNTLREYIKKDKIKVNIIDITKLGLVELTRKKIRRSLSSDFYKTCPTCNGRGNILEI